MAITKQDVALGWLAMLGVTLSVFILACSVYVLWIAPWQLSCLLVVIGVTGWAIDTAR